MSAPVCAVTGATGFAGRNIARRMQAAGWRVIALVRQPEKAGIEARRFILGELPPPETLAGVELLIHTAYDFSLRSWPDICRVNVVGSDYLFDAATRAGVKKQIFISSLSAFEGCRSHYGSGKLTAENAVHIRGGIAIRPGMIYSAENGGLAATIEKVARDLPVIPMIGHGRYPLYTCHVDDLCAFVLALAQADKWPDNIVVAANSAPVTLLDLVKAGARGKRRLIITTPPSWITAGLWLLERCGLRPAFRSDSVRSLVHTNPAVDFSATQKWPVTFRPFADGAKT